MCHLLYTKRPKLENPQADLFQVVILFWPSAFHCGFQVLVSGIFPFVRKQYKAFSIHFKTSLQVTFTSIRMLTSTSRRDRDGNVSLGGMAGWSKKKVVGSGMNKAYVGPSVLLYPSTKKNSKGRRFLFSLWCSPVPELSFLPAPYRGWTRACERRVQDNLHAHAQNAAIFSP